jgi:hypothetical protein
MIMIATLILPSLIGDGLITGLIKRWGGVFPRWLPFVGGRRAPISPAVLPVSFVAITILWVASCSTVFPHRRIGLVNCCGVHAHAPACQA